jgi:hypothetical protein
MAQEEGEQLLTLAAQVVGAGVAGPDQVANGFVNHVRNPDPGQLPGTMQPRQRHRVPPVGLDPFAWPLRDQRRRHHHAVVAKIPNLPVQSVTRRPGLEADMQAIVLPGQLLDRPLDHGRPVLDLAEKPDFTAAVALGDRDRVLQLRHVERDERFVISFHGSPSVREARLGPPEQSSSLSIAR